MTSEKTLLFLSTFPSKSAAQVFARKAVGGNYAACVNVVGPIRSFYRWAGKMNDAQEFLVLGKTTPKAFKKLKKDIKKLHPYDLPELVALKIAGGLEVYLDWIRKNCAGSATNRKEK